MKKALMALCFALTSSTAMAADTPSTVINMLEVRGTKTYVWTADTSQCGGYFNLDASAGQAEHIISTLLAAKLSGRTARIWFNDTDTTAGFNCVIFGVRIN